MKRASGGGALRYGALESVRVVAVVGGGARTAVWRANSRIVHRGSCGCRWSDEHRGSRGELHFTVGAEHEVEIAVLKGEK